nr:DNA-directed DNA polymerase [Tanacetum cinerariifolium]
MQTRSSSKFVCESSSNPISTNSKHRNRIRSKPRVEPFSIPIVTMADYRTMEEMLQSPTNELHQINTFYNGLNEHEQDSLNAAAGGNLLRKTPQDALIIIENKLKVRYSRNKPVAFKVSTTSSGNASSTDARIDKLTDTISNLVETFNKKITTPATVKAVEETCVIYGGAHLYYESIATDSNISSVFVTSGTYNQGSTGFRPYVATNYHASPPGFPPNQINNVKNELRSDISNQTNELRNTMASYFQMNTTSSLGSGSLPSNTVPNPRADLKAITTRSGVTLAGPSVSSLSKEVDREPETITDQVLTGSTNNVAPLVVQPSPASTSFSTISSSKIPEKLPHELGDPDKFPIPCDFPELDECLALVDLGASINLMPLFIWRKLSLPELTSTQMILELADRSTTRPAGIAEDETLLRTRKALIDVYGEELTRCIDDEAITFKEYVQEVLGFSDNSKSGSPTPTSDPIISSSSTSFTPFKGRDFVLEEIETFLQTLDELSDLDDDYYDTEGNILYLEKLQNEDPSPNLPLVKTKDLKQVDATMTKPSIEEPPELKLKELPSHLEYAFLEGTDKLPVIISKELKHEEKSALLKVLKSHKQAIAWKIFKIKGINPRFCTYKILMEDDFKPTVQHQRRPVVSPVYCVPKKGGMTVVKNEDNELIPTRSRLTHKTKKRLPSLALMERLLTDVCILVYVMLLARSIENLAADHLSRLENPHQDELEKSKSPRHLSRDSFSRGSSKPDGPDRSPSPMFFLMGPLSYLKLMILTLRVALDLEASRVRGFVHRPLEFQSLVYGYPIS